MSYIYIKKKKKTEQEFFYISTVEDVMKII